MIDEFAHFQDLAERWEARLEVEKQSKKRTRLMVNLMVVFTGVMIVASFLATPFLVVIPVLAWLPFSFWVAGKNHDAVIEHAERMLKEYQNAVYRISQRIIEEF